MFTLAEAYRVWVGGAAPRVPLNAGGPVLMSCSARAPRRSEDGEISMTCQRPFRSGSFRPWVSLVMNAIPSAGPGVSLFSLRRAP